MKLPEKEIIKFKLTYKIPEGKTVIYAGNANRQKGVYEVYNALKDKDTTLSCPDHRTRQPIFPYNTFN